MWEVDFHSTNANSGSRGFVRKAVQVICQIAITIINSTCSSRIHTLKAEEKIRIVRNPKILPYHLSQSQQLIQQYSQEAKKKINSSIEEKIIKNKKES